MMIIMAVYMIGWLTLGADCPIFFLKNNISKGFEYVGFMDEAISISCFIFFQKNLHVSSRSYPIILLDYGKAEPKMEITVEKTYDAYNLLKLTDTKLIYNK